MTGIFRAVSAFMETMGKAGAHDQMRQLSLSLPDAAPRYDRDAFLISDANASAWRALAAWEASEEPALIICGPPGSGKTHLAHIAAERSNGVVADATDWPEDTLQAALIVIDNLPAPDPRSFLARLEEATGNGARLVLAGAGHPGEWAMGLKDLRTRLEAMPRASLGEPDETLIRAVIAKGFKDRQLEVSQQVVDYAAPRLPRTFAAARAFVALADRAGLEEKRRITTPLIQKIVDNLSEGLAGA